MPVLEYLMRAPETHVVLVLVGWFMGVITGGVLALAQSR